MNGTAGEGYGWNKYGHETGIIGQKVPIKGKGKEKGKGKQRKRKRKTGG